MLVKDVQIRLHVELEKQITTELENSEVIIFFQPNPKSRTLELCADHTNHATTHTNRDFFETPAKSQKSRRKL